MKWLYIGLAAALMGLAGCYAQAQPATQPEAVLQASQALGCKPAEIKVQSETHGQQISNYTITAQDKTYFVSCNGKSCKTEEYHPAEHQSVSGGGGGSYDPSPSYSAGPHCTTGCPCGNACISCSKKCSK